MKRSALLLMTVVSSCSYDFKARNDVDSQTSRPDTTSASEGETGSHRPSDSDTGGDTASDSKTGGDTASDSKTGGDTASDSATGSAPSCVDMSCASPSQNECNTDGELVIWNSIGWCDLGECHYAHHEEDCEAGECADGICMQSPCQGVTCNTPPQATCRDSATLLVSQQDGWCEAGQCDYTEVEVACASGCNSGSCLDNPCAAVVCRAPPARYCEGDVLIVYDTVGRCQGATGCAYGAQPVECGLGSCTAGHCNNGDVCGQVSCYTPPSRYCADSATLRSFSAPGACDKGACLYTALDVPCVTACVNGACQDEPCAGISCRQPPASYCSDATHLRHWSGVDGLCTSGVCIYEVVDSVCEHGCALGECVKDPCTGKICATPPAAHCEGAWLVTYPERGTCKQEGWCDYAETRQECQGGCASAACQPDTESGSETTDTTDTGSNPDTTSATVTSADTTGTDTGTDTAENGMVWSTIPAGSFWMGTPDGSCPADYPGGAACTSELGRETDEELHYVTLTQGLEVMQTEVTQAQFAALMGYNPSYSGPSGGGENCGDTCPVEQVSWHEALAFANTLSTRHGLSECFDCTGTGPSVTCSLKTTYSKPQDCPGFRLPTESEWEYASRAGTLTAFYNGAITTLYSSPLDPNLDAIGWYSSNASTTPHPVMGKLPNAWNLYDMSGNVWEWTWDWKGTYPVGGTATPVVDPVGLTTGTQRVLRGGAYAYIARLERCGSRVGYLPTTQYRAYGFRLVRSVPLPTRQCLQTLKTPSLNRNAAPFTTSWVAPFTYQLLWGVCSSAK